MNINFLGWTKTAVWVSVILMIAGSFLFFEQRKTMFGMDFTGGYSLTVEASAPEGKSPRHLAEEALVQAGAASRDVQVRELNKPTQLKIQLGTGMEEKGSPFASMTTLPQEEKTLEQVTWVVQALEKGGLKLAVPNPEELQMGWSIMSGQFSDTMRWSASIALACALLAILLYITFRFEWKYAVGAVVGLVHDVILTLGVLAFFHFIGFPVQIDLVVVGALMTLIGYSLNDTIIIFDRIREEVKTMRKADFPTVVNHALNVTLSRTLVTSGTTLLVLLCLLFLGGMSIFAFSLVMAVGVFVGTLSSLFIAAPVMLYMHGREETKVRGLQSSLVM